MDLNRKKPTFAAVFLFAAAVAAVMLGICSRSSPFHPFNNWADVNCFFTVGKAICSGKVVYRDIYEQKGILLYFLYALAYLISNRDLFGGYILEVLSMTIFLLMVYGTFRSFSIERRFFLVAPVLCAVLCSTRSFYPGGGVEELMLPALYLPIYVILKDWRTGKDCIPGRRDMFLLGVGAACLLWSKFILVGSYFGYVLFGTVVLIRRRDWSQLGSCALFFALGALAASAPWLLYFVVNHAMKDMFEVYFYNNIFVYPVKRTLHNYLAVLVMAFLKNIFMMAFIFLGVFAVLRSDRGREWKAGMFCLFFFNVLFIYAGGVSFEYYAFGMAALSVPGAVYAGLLLDSRLRGKNEGRGTGKVRVAAVVCVLLLSVGFAYLRSDNSFLLRSNREDMWYYKFANEILASDDHSLLNYDTLDLGIYTLTGYVPQGRFFCKLNLTLDEMQEELDASIREQKTEWVVLTKDPASVAPYYDIVMKEDYFFTFPSEPCTFYLARRK